MNPCPPHDRPVDSAPRFVAEYVQVPQVCLRCGRVIALVSFTREEWDRRMANLDAQPDLPGLRSEA